MKKQFSIISLLLSAFMVLMLVSAKPPANTDKKDKIYFVSLNLAIKEGQLEGVKSVKELKQQGDFGLGSEERLASELVMVDGKAYGIPWNGKATILKDEAQIAFAAVKFFKSDTTIALSKKVTLEELKNILSLVVDTQAFSAIRIKTRFAKVKYRSYKKEALPKTPTDQAMADTLQQQAMPATIVGFYTPKSAMVLNSPPYHFHVIDSARTTGGHLLEGTLDYAKIEIDYATSLEIDLPKRKHLHQVNINKNAEE